jgi:hypothetical protein
MVTVELMFGSVEGSIIRDLPAVPRRGEMVIVYGDDNPFKDTQSHFRVKDVWWTVTSEALQNRTLVSVMLG